MKSKSIEIEVGCISDGSPIVGCDVRYLLTESNTAIQVIQRLRDIADDAMILPSESDLTLFPSVNKMRTL
jgi:hypothetical protein